MATFRISIQVTKKGIRREAVVAYVQKLLETVQANLGEECTSTAKVDKVNTEPSRADRLAEANEARSLAQEIVEELADELETWRDSIPENLQGGDKYSQVEEAADALRTAADDLENVDLEGIEMPSMF